MRIRGGIGHRLWLVSASIFIATSLAKSAMAADMPAPAPTPPPTYVPVAPPYNWSGIYIGANAGYGFATATATATLPGFGSASASETLSGFIGGGQIGGNYQIGPVVIGVEGDFEGSTQSETTTVGILSANDSIPWLGTVRGRVGAAFDRFLIYATGGGGYGQFTSTITAGGLGSISASQSHFAWAAGGGVEFGITNNISARLEYLYLDTGTLNLATIGLLTINGRVQDNLIRAGANFRFSL